MSQPKKKKVNQMDARELFEHRSEQAEELRIELKETLSNPLLFVDEEDSLLTTTRLVERYRAALRRLLKARIRVRRAIVAEVLQAIDKEQWQNAWNLVDELHRLDETFDFKDQIKTVLREMEVTLAKQVKVRVQDKHLVITPPESPLEGYVCHQIRAEVYSQTAASKFFYSGYTELLFQLVPGKYDFIVVFYRNGFERVEVKVEGVIMPDAKLNKVRAELAGLIGAGPLAISDEPLPVTTANFV